MIYVSVYTHILYSKALYPMTYMYTPLIFPCLNQKTSFACSAPPGFGGFGLFCHGSSQGPLQQRAEHCGQCHGQPHHVPW
jgi:hypothetical protein